MLIDLTTAKLHLRVDSSDEDALIGVYLAAAEGMAVEIMDRKLYADIAALNAAVAAAPAAFAAAVAAYGAALDAALLLTDEDESREAVRVAMLAYTRARIEARQTHDGIAINDIIKAAMLLIVGHIYANREDVGMPTQKLPNGAEWLLQPYRVYT